MRGSRAVYAAEDVTRYQPTDEQAAFRTAVREFADERITPVTDEFDREARYPDDILAELGEKRWTGLTLPESYGGLGKGYIDLAILTEELTAASMPVGLNAARAIATAKLEATEAAVDNANDAVQLHGGIGYTRGRSVERYLRDAKFLTIAGGPNAGHRDTLAEHVFGEPVRPPDAGRNP